MARSKRVKLKMLDDDSTSKLEREENLRAWIIASREEEHKISLWKRYPKLSSSWSERNSVFRFFVKDLLERNPIVGVVCNDKIVLAVEKNSTDSGYHLSFSIYLSVADSTRIFTSFDLRVHEARVRVFLSIKLKGICCNQRAI